MPGPVKLEGFGFVYSCNVAKMLLEVLSTGRAIAKELSNITGVDSKSVYANLRLWVSRGLVRIEKLDGINLYLPAVDGEKRVRVVEALKRFVDEECREEHEDER